MKKLIIPVLFILSMSINAYAACTGSSPTWSCTPDYTSLDNLINQNTPAGFTAEDTVNISAGSETWGSTLAITEGVNLIGAGIGQTNITSGGGSFMISYIPAIPANNDTLRISGLTLNGGARNVKGIYVANTSSTDTITNIRIDNNEIKNLTSSNIYMEGMIYGLIDNNVLESGSGVFYLSGNDNYSWANAIEWGTANYIYIEDNTISGGSDWYIIQSNEGTRWVFRYNNVDVGGTGGNTIDMHGNQSYNTSNIPDSCALTLNARGGLGTEIYRNSFTNYNSELGLIDHRGGSTFTFNNTSTGTYPTASVQIREEDNAEIGDCYPIKVDYPGFDPVQNAYFWNNVGNGINSFRYSNPSYITMIQDQRDYWSDYKTYQDAGDYTTPNTYWSEGLASAVPAECTDEDVYWATDTEELYRCKGTDNMTSVYTPYTYPHPLRSESVTPPSKPITPSPADNATDITLTPLFSWADGGTNADTYSVYLGIPGRLWLVSDNQTGLTFTHSVPLPRDTVVNWRIDATNDNSTTTGDVWSFTTINASAVVSNINSGGLPISNVGSGGLLVISNLH